MSAPEIPSPPNAAADASAPPVAAAPARRRLGCQAALIVVILATVAVFGVIYYLFQSDPTWWKANQQFIKDHTEGELYTMADSVQGRVVGMGNFILQDAPAPDAPRHLVITRDEMRAWMALKFQEELRNQGYRLPKEISMPSADLIDGHLVIFFKYDTPELSKVISLYCTAAAMPDGQVKFQVERAYAGRLPIPISALTKHLAKQGADKRTNLMESLRKVIDGVPLDPSNLPGLEKPPPKITVNQIKITGDTMTIDFVRTPAPMPSKRENG